MNKKITRPTGGRAGNGGEGDGQSNRHIYHWSCGGYCPTPAFYGYGVGSYTRHLLCLLRVDGKKKEPSQTVTAHPLFGFRWRGWDLVAG